MHSGCMYSKVELIIPITEALYMGFNVSKILSNFIVFLFYFLQYLYMFTIFSHETNVINLIIS